MNVNIKTEKVYTFPDRKLYGEYCAVSLLELRLKIIRGEIKEELCILDENDRAYCYDKFGVLEHHPDWCLDHLHISLLTEIIKGQVEIRKNEKTI